MRRVHQRKLKRSGPDACQEEREEAKLAKSNLVKSIKRSKEEKWKKLCDQVQQDPWGMPFKLIMGKLVKHLPIPGLSTPGRLDAIIQGLFPQHPARVHDVWSPFCNQHVRDAYFTTEELLTAARCLKKNAAPGPDSIINDVLKSFAHSKPEFAVNVYNKCLVEGVFPKI